MVLRCGVFYRLFAPNFVFSSIISNFAASSSNTVFLWIHVLDLCVLLKIALFVRMDVSVFFHNFTKVYGLFALHVNVGRLFCNTTQKTIITTQKKNRKLPNKLLGSEMNLRTCTCFMKHGRIPN